jgi:hypothetical protein
MRFISLLDQSGPFVHFSSPVTPLSARNSLKTPGLDHYSWTKVFIVQFKWRTPMPRNRALLPHRGLVPRALTIVPYLTTEEVSRLARVCQGRHRVRD